MDEPVGTVVTRAGPREASFPVGRAEIRHIMSEKANRCNIISDASGVAPRLLKERPRLRR